MLFFPQHLPPVNFDKKKQFLPANFPRIYVFVELLLFFANFSTFSPKFHIFSNQCVMDVMFALFRFTISMVLFVQLALKYSHTNLDKTHRCKKKWVLGFRTNMRHGLRRIASPLVCVWMRTLVLAAKVFFCKRYFDLFEVS